MPKRFVIALLVLVCAFPAAAQSKKAKNTLKLLQTVDGAGSGLDADTVQGMTPAQLKAEVVGTPGPQGPQGPQGLQGPPGPSNASTLNGYSATQIMAATVQVAIAWIRDHDYLKSTDAVLGAFECQCAEAVCAGSDFRINCGGSTTTGLLFEVGPVPEAPTTCRACGCSGTAELGVITATAVCVGAP